MLRSPDLTVQEEWPSDVCEAKELHDSHVDIFRKISLTAEWKG